MSFNILVKEGQGDPVNETLSEILDFLPLNIKNKLKTEISEIYSDIEEIRVRKNRKIAIRYNGRNKLLNITVSKSDIDYTVNRLCKFSVYSYQADINNGFITTDSGCRVGIIGKSVFANDNMVSVKDISSLNFRIAKDFFGSSNAFLNTVPENIIIAGPPSSGKTTLLRDVARNYSSLSYNVCVVDERNEISPDNFYLGEMTDCLKSYKKAFGISLALRTLSPQVIIFDEIGSIDECNSVIESLNSGVNIVTSIHCKNKKQFFNRNIVKALISTDFFDKVVFLNEKPGRIDEILKLGEL